MLETDLDKIMALAEVRWNDNWNFRAYLQQAEDPAQVDRVVHQLNAEVSAQVDCTQCANCCRQISPHLTETDVPRIAACVHASAEKFAKDYLEADEFGEQMFRVSPCPMLKGTRCQVYAGRPEDCRSYPHLHEPDFVRYMVTTIENYSVCPIVFNVVEKLKVMFSYDPATSYLDHSQEDATDL